MDEEWGFLPLTLGQAAVALARRGSYRNPRLSPTTLLQRATIQVVRLVMGFGLMVLYGANAAATEDICIPSPIKSSAVTGAVYYGSERRPLADVKVEILPYAYGAPAVASSTTGSEGTFSIPGIKPGRYWLNAKHPVVGHFAVECRIVHSFFRSRHTRIVIVIGVDPAKGRALIHLFGRAWVLAEP